MKLRYSPTSPYARKAWITLLEKGLGDKIEIVPTLPWAPDSDLPRDNPLGKVPVLVLDDGTSLYDSRVICEFLDDLGGGPTLFPTGIDRWRALKVEALASGLMDAAVTRLLETRRPEGKIWDEWSNRYEIACRRALAALDESSDQFGTDFSIDQIATAAALGYLDFRFPQDKWRQQVPRLATWFDTVSQRPTMVATQPKD